MVSGKNMFGDGFRTRLHFRGFLEDQGLDLEQSLFAHGKDVNQQATWRVTAFFRASDLGQGLSGVLSP